jgi:phage major head subunit gpT-like protein
MATVTPVQPTTGNTHISSDFGKLLEPGLRKIFFETYAEVPEQFSKVYNVNTSKKSHETDYGLGAFGDWTERTSELDTVAYDKLSAGLERNYVHKAFTKGFMIGRELYDDEQYRQINKFPQAMARSGRAFVEKQAATTFINAFDGTSHAIYDGKALLATDHPLVDSTGKGSNLVTGALTPANLKIAMECMRETVDEAGNLIASSAKKLVVPPALEFEAREILHSTQLAGTDLNNINSLKGSLDLVVYDYLGEAAGGSDSAWFLIDPTVAQINFFWRVKPEFKWDDDFDTFVAKYRGYMRFSYGVSDWRGIVGSKGATA